MEIHTCTLAISTDLGAKLFPKVVVKINFFSLMLNFFNILQRTIFKFFKNVINKSKEDCKGSDIAEEEHFAGVRRVLKVSNNADMEVDDLKLTRYACYLIAQNGDSRKKAIELAQTYFAVQTRRQEITRQEYEQLSEDDACKTHHNVGQAVRQTIKRIGGTMPEDLPTPAKSAKQIENEKNKLIMENKK